eukprot:COSAG02_NODE_33205_length_503_cov_11.477723_1_plen_20_part_10
MKFCINSMNGVRSTMHPRAP